MAILDLLADGGGDDTPRGRVAVTVRQIEDGSGGYPDTPFEKKLAVALAPATPTRIDAPAGRYRIETRLPDGRVVRTERDVHEGGVQTVILELGEPGGAWRSVADAYPVTNRTLSRSAMSASAAVPLSTHPGAIAKSAFPTFGFALGFPHTRPTITIQRRRAEAYVIGADPTNGSPPGLRLDERPASDPLVQVWRVPGNLVPAFSGKRGGMVVIEHPSGVSVVRLPLPWLTEYGEPCDAEVLFDGLAPVATAVRLSVRDPEHAMLLGYLGAGRIADARVSAGDDIGGQIARAIETKMHNPLMAAAAAYIGLASPEAGAERRAWSPWLANLMNAFPEIPDGAIVYARDLLDRANNPDDRRQALEALKTAYRRGTPYFSAGVQHLLSGLFPYAQSVDEESSAAIFDSEAAAMHREISLLASRIDVTQTFTVETVSTVNADV